MASSSPPPLPSPPLRLHPLQPPPTSPKSVPSKLPSLRIIISSPHPLAKLPSNHTNQQQREDNFPYTDIPRPTVGEANKRPEFMMWAMFQSRANRWFYCMFYVAFVLALGLWGTLVGFVVTRDTDLVYYMSITGYGASVWMVATWLARRHSNQQVEHLTDYVEAVMDQPGRRSVSSNSSASVAVVGVGVQDDFHL